MNLSKQIAKLIANNVLAKEHIDEWVVDLHLDMATEINNAGLKAQLAFILTRVSEGDILDELDCPSRPEN